MSGGPVYPDPGREESNWTITGSEDLPLFGKTTLAQEPARAVVVLVHGYTGHLDRNIVPVVAHMLADLGCIVHRFNLGHCGIEPGEDRITRLDLFERDGIRHSIADIQAVIEAVYDEALAGRKLPLLLVGHSRAGATVLGAAVRAKQDAWPLQPCGVITLASIGRYARTNPELLATIEREGFIEREAARAEGGVVRLGRSWYEHELDSPGGDPFPGDMTTLADLPVAIIHGGADTSVPVSESERIHQLLRQSGNQSASLSLIEGADHNFSAKGVLGVDLRWDAAIGERTASALQDAVTRIVDQPIG